MEKYGDVSFLGTNSSGRNTINQIMRDGNFERLEEWLLINDLKLLEEYKGVKDINGDIIYYSFKHLPSGNEFIDHVACGRIPIYKDPNDSKWCLWLRKKYQIL